MNRDILVRHKDNIAFWIVPSTDIPICKMYDWPDTHSNQTGIFVKAIKLLRISNIWNMF